MQVEPLRLSDFDSEDAFIQAMIDRSWNPAQVNYYKKDGDFDRIKRLMDCTRKLANLASENGLCFWTYADYDGNAVVGVSWGARYSHINIEADGDDWVERCVSYDDIINAEKGMECK